MKTVKVTIEFEFETETKKMSSIRDEALGHLIAQVEDEGIASSLEIDIVHDDEDGYV